MKVRIRALQGAETVKGRLVRDGWNVDRGPDGSLSASHPYAESEDTARVRLHELGFLTSRTLQIEFSIEPRK